MALAVGASCLVSLVLSILTMSGMQMLKPVLVSSQIGTITAGFLGSLLFVFLLTCIGNLERLLFGLHFQTKWGESVLCLALSVFASASVHRVSATTCVLFSCAMLYAIVNIASATYDKQPSGSQDQLGQHLSKQEKNKKKHK